MQSLGHTSHILRARELRVAALLCCASQTNVSGFWLWMILVNVLCAGSKHLKLLKTQ